MNTPNSGFTPGTPVFAHYISARRWYAPSDLAKVNNSEIERVTEMDKRKKKDFEQSPKTRPLYRFWMGAWYYCKNHLKYQLQWGSEIWPYKIRKHSKFGLFEGRISNSRALAKAVAIILTIWQPDHSKYGHFCLDFKWLGFWISDPIRNLDHLQPNLFTTIQNPD